jgi:hypothetical protein
MIGLLLALLLCLASPQAQSASAAPQLLWEEPRPLTVLDWTWGPGGKERAPRGPFHFVKENLGGTNPKVEVADAQGPLWIVKFGGEVHTDTFLSRLLYATDYLAEPIYFVPTAAIQSVHGLKRAKPFVPRNGLIRDVRFKLRDDRVLAYADEFQWSWTDNPFLGSHELNGLKILIMLASNWDTKDARDGEGSNTAVFLRRQPGTPAYYAFADWGASLGSWGGFFRRSRWDSAAYERQTSHFVKQGRDGELLWGFTGKHGPEIRAGITVADVRWLVPYLRRTTGEQLRAGLLASGGSTVEAERFTRCIQNRITQLKSIAATAP